MLRKQREQGNISEGEFRNAMTEKIIDFFERAQIFERSQEILKSEKIKESISFQDFKDFLIRINGFIRNIPIQDRDVDGRNVYIGGSAEIKYFPSFEEKENLLFRAFENIDNIDKNDLKYYIPLMITAIHIFKDGNGRTSRICNLLLNDPMSKEELSFGLDDILGLDGRYKGYDINPGYIEKEIDNFLINKHGLNSESVESSEAVRLNINQGLNLPNFEILDHLTDSNNGFMDLWGSNKNIGNLTLIIYLQSKNLIDNCLNDKGILDIKLLNQFLSKDDWLNLEEDFRNILKERVELLIDIFVNPDEYHMDRYNPTTLKDLLISRINRQKE